MEMSGLKIMHRLVDVGYNEPTRIYEVVELENGRLDMRLVFEERNIAIMTLAMILDHFDIKRPVVLVDPHPPVIEELKRRGIRVR